MEPFHERDYASKLKELTLTLDPVLKRIDRQHLLRIGGFFKEQGVDLSEDAPDVRCIFR